jgi:hypothetical protein
VHRYWEYKYWKIRRYMPVQWDIYGIQDIRVYLGLYSRTPGSCCIKPGISAYVALYDLLRNLGSTFAFERGVYRVDI